MKRTKEFVIRQVADETVLIPTGPTAKDFNGIVSLTEVGAFIWKRLETVRSLDELVALITEEYEVNQEEAQSDAIEFISHLIKVGMVQPETPEW